MAINTSPDMSLKINNLYLKNPIITASGTFGYADEFESYVDLQNIGAIITKGITLKPKSGNPQPRIREVRGGLINWIGLENMGIDAFIEHKLPVLNKKNINYIVNIAGSSIEEYVELARICSLNDIKAIELNVSCPNVKEGCLEFGKEPEMLYQLVSQVREQFSNALIVKLSSNVSYPEKIALAVQKAGADAISAINTAKGMAIKTSVENGKIKYDKVKGGLSGPCIKPLALNFIHDIKGIVDIPIIGMGGISSLDDVLDFMAVGSNAVQIGTANFTHPNISHMLAEQLGTFMLNNGMKNLNCLRGNNNAN